MELPPRTRRIHFARNPNLDFRGTTSAYAENTYLRGHAGSLGRNYLRVRGEYRLMPDGFSKVEELPPRTRRIRQPGILAMFPLGTTSAYAENTLNELGLL